MLKNFIKYLKYDFNYIFSLILKINFHIWSVKPWKLKYKEYTFSNVIDLISHICIYSGSTKCRNLLIENIKKKGKDKKKFKKIKRRNNKWSN